MCVREYTSAHTTICRVCVRNYTPAHAYTNRERERERERETGKTKTERQTVDGYSGV